MKNPPKDVWEEVVESELKGGPMEDPNIITDEEFARAGLGARR